MPHKNEMYDSFNEPYGETYCVDDGLWYDDDTEIFPEPLSKPIRPYNFSIISHLGEYYLEDKYGISEQNKEDLVDCMNWLKKENLGHIGDFAYNISFQIQFDDASLKSYINEYCQTNGITISERRKMIERANFIIQNGYRQFQDDKEID